MKPFYKYTGGKTKEINKIIKFFPKETKRIIEPFCGSCAVSFNFGLPAIVSDINDNVINLLEVVKDKNLYDQLIVKINHTNIDDKKTEKNNLHLEKLYYDQRDNYFLTKDKVEKAYRYLVLRQLCFSGMTRINQSTGNSNVPYGWYGMFKTRLNLNYHNLLQTWNIINQSFENTIDMATNNDDWIFIDPPYFERNSKYDVNSDAGESKELHIKLFNKLNKLKTKWLLIHSDCELYRDLYKNFTINVNDFQYAQNFKGREMKQSKVQHLYITNYSI